MPVVLSTQQQHQEKLVLGSISRSADTIDLGFLGRIGISIKFLDAVDLGTTLWKSHNSILYLGSSSKSLFEESIRNIKRPSYKLKYWKHQYYYK